MTTTVGSLNAAWARWCNVLKDLSLEEAPHRQVIHTRLLRACSRHPDEQVHLKTVLGCLSKGKHLVEAAVRWEEPVAGPRPDSEGTPTDRARGEQFRLVMAHAGMETVLDALLPVEERQRVEEAEMRAFLGQCGLLAYEPLPAPRRDLAELEKWLAFEEDQGPHPLTTFLKLNSSDTRILRRWLLEGVPVADWYAALRLAKVLRNSTVHGSLSASKVCGWGLRPAFQTLGTNIGDVVAGALGMLCR